MKNKFKIFIMLTLALIIFTSCSDDNEVNTDGQGEVKVQLTDGPFPFDFVTEANIGVAKIELKNSSGEYTTVFEGSATYNMIGLTNGVSTNVATTNIAVGTYVEAKITLNSASVHLSNGTDYDLNVSSVGVQQVAIIPNLIVEDAVASEVLFDLDINDSFQFFGMGGVSFPSWITSMNLINGCNFNPDFRVCDRDITGEISGTVTVDGSNEENAQVHIFIDGNKISTHTEANGSFTFIGVENGTYTVHVTTEGNLTSQVDNVSVVNSGSVSCTVTID